MGCCYLKRINIIEEESTFLSINKTNNNKFNILLESLCKINREDIGFLCKIPFNEQNDLLPVLITNITTLGKNEILTNKTIKIIGNKKEYNILIDDSRKIFINDDNKYNIVIIEIKENDGLDLNSFSEIDTNIETFIDKEAFIIYISPRNNIDFIECKIHNINEHEILFGFNNVNEKSLLFSPIINIDNHKVIGITEGFKKK